MEVNSKMHSKTMFESKYKTSTVGTILDVQTHAKLRHSGSKVQNSVRN